MSAMTQPLPAPPDPDPNSREPLLSVGFIVTAVTVVLDLLVIFGVHLPDATRTTVLTATTLAAPLIVAVWGRRKVFSPATVATLLTTRRP